MLSWLNTPWFDYSLSRPITLRHFNLLVLVFGVIYVAFITLINIAAVGYEPVTVVDSDYNKTVTPWYQRFLVKTSLLPEPWACNVATISANDGFTSFNC
jgi:hypothetical protein